LLCVKNTIQCEQIVAITLGIPQVIQGRLTSNLPKDIQAAQMSAPFCVALSIFKSAQSPEFTINVDDVEAGLNNPEVMRLCHLIQCVLDPEVEETSSNESVSAKLIIQLASGEIVSTQVNAPKGSSSRPYRTEDFQINAALELQRRYPIATTQEIISCVKQFSTLSEIKQLTNLLQ
jgi:2-methylcitrate dehydratase PrpD